MTAKEYATMLVPIIVNGLFIFIAQKVLSRKIDRLNRSQDLRDKIVGEFLARLKELNNTLIQGNFDISRDPSASGPFMERVQCMIVELIKYEDANSFDLGAFSKPFKDLLGKWSDFAQSYYRCAGNRLTVSMKVQLGMKMQSVKDALKALIERVRKKY